MQSPRYPTSPSPQAPGLTRGFDPGLGLRTARIDPDYDLGYEVRCRLDTLALMAQHEPTVLHLEAIAALALSALWIMAGDDR